MEVLTKMGWCYNEGGGDGGGGVEKMMAVVVVSRGEE